MLLLLFCLENRLYCATHEGTGRCNFVIFFNDDYDLHDDNGIGIDYEGGEEIISEVMEVLK